MRPSIRHTGSRPTLRLALVVAAAIAAPGVARAQLDDPGLAPPPSAPRTAPPAPPATPPPPARPKPLPPPAVVPPPVQPPQVREEVKEEVTTSPTATLSDDEWDRMLVAPTIGGGVGLLHMLTPEVGNPLYFRVGLHVQAFTADSFLVAGSGSTAGDTNQRFMGDLTIGLTGPDVTFLRNLELYLGIFNSSNLNDRVDQGRTDPKVILGLGDIAVGLKGGAEVVKGLSLGGNVNVRFFNSISGVLALGAATSASFDFLATYDVRRVAPGVPLRFHLNFGYFLDNSINLLPDGQCAKSVSNDACIRSRVVETFAYGLGVQRLRIALGVEAPLRPHVSWGIFGVAPFFEFHIEHAVGDGDTTVANALTKDGHVAADRISDTNTMYGTLGLRLRPVARLVVDLGVDLGMMSPGFAYGPPVPAWNVILGAAYTYDGQGSQTKVIKRTITRTVEVNAAPPEGRIRGIVRDAKTKKPLAGAIVKYAGRTLSPQATGEDGTFLSYGLPAGPVTVEVSRGDDYKTASASAEVQVGAESPLEVMLPPSPPRESKVRLKVTDEKGAPVVGGAAHFTGPVIRDGSPEADGFVVMLPPGDYAAAIDAPGYLARERQFSVQANREAFVDIQIRKRPASSHVQLTRDAIVIKGVIHFGTNNAVIFPDGQQLLDEVADVLAKNHQIRKVAIEGHTDNKGVAQANLKLSRDRAQACMDFLVKQGIAVERLSAEGFGASKPLVPNLTPANRAKNRRVEFRIVDQGGFPQ